MIYTRGGCSPLSSGLCVTLLFAQRLTGGAIADSPKHQDHSLEWTN